MPKTKLKIFPQVALGLYLVFRIGLASVFIYSGILKLSRPEVFAVLIGAYGLVPEFIITPISILLPLLEVTAGIGLLFDIKGCLTIITSMLSFFSLFLGYAIFQGLDIDCGCLGPQDPEAAAFHGLRSALYRDLMMFVAVGYLYWWRWRYRQGPSPLEYFFKKWKRTI
jgi:uncharacterized membrane protein YphA (DoxX/SURF4 family)